MGTLSKIQYSFKALLLTLPSGYYFGATNYPDNDDDSLASALGIDNHTLVSYFHNEKLTWISKLPLTKKGAKRFRSLSMGKFGIPILSSEKSIDALCPEVSVKRYVGEVECLDKKNNKKKGKYWMRSPYDLVQYELSRRALRRCDMSGIRFPLVDQPCMVLGYFGDHGNLADVKELDSFL